jgi:hypothetical protein
MGECEDPLIVDAVPTSVGDEDAALLGGQEVEVVDEPRSLSDGDLETIVHQGAAQCASLRA